MTMPKFHPVAHIDEDDDNKWATLVDDLDIKLNAPLYTADQLAEAYEAGKREQAAQIEMLREALIACRDDLELRMKLSEDDSLNISNYVLDKMLDAIDTTPDQALERFSERVREQCIDALDPDKYPNECDKSMVYNCKLAIHAIKEFP